MPGLIPEAILEQVRQSSDVVDVIGSYFPLKRAGANFRALCPFHKEKTPSFNVNPQKQIWHCFGCGEGGNVFNFVMKYENLDFIAAVRRLADRAGIRLEFEETAGGVPRDQKELLFKLHEQAAAFFHQTLLKDRAAEIARQYLQKRRLEPATVKKWQLGYSPDSWDALLRWANEKKFAVELLESAGLAVRGDRGFYDRFRGRLMFPIGDEQGRVVAFSGRILTDAKDQAKYVNSPETPIFQKGKILFALDKAKRAILDAKFAIICEGQVDTIACHEAGLTNVVAPQGTALTEHHARILKRHTDEVVLMFDADEAGQKASVRNAESLWDAGFLMRVVVLPGNHDPDSFLKESGPQALQDLIAKAPSFLDFLLQRLCSQFDARTDRGKLHIAERIMEWLCRIHDPILQASFAQQTAAHLGLEEEVVRAQMKKYRAGTTRPSSAAAPAPVAEPEPDRPASQPAEELLLHLMLLDDRVIEAVSQRLDRAWLSGSVAGDLIGRVLDLTAAQDWNGAGGLLDKISDEEAGRLITRLLSARPPPADQSQRWTAECLGTLERHWAGRAWRALRLQLSQGKLSPQEVSEVQRQLLDLRTKLDNSGESSV